MAYQAFYRKYRPATFSEVTGQEHITQTLKNQLSAGKIFHAYLFTGTRGTGKTSCAKILARAVNCLDLHDGDPCMKCDICSASVSGELTDIVEIDAASNNGVENIRELREQVNFTPAVTKYRVYIIDEVHMLSAGAFNALLKTLEEPPKHVIFILATTEAHKLPATILSRCQRFDFRRIEAAKICERIQYVASNEGFTITPAAAELIAAAADGGMRDALSILDLCAANGGEIDEATVERVCAMAGSDYLFSFADCVKTGNVENGLMLIDSLHNTSVDMLRLLGELISHYRNLMIVKTVRGERPIVCSAAQLEKYEAQAAGYEIKDIMRCLSLLQGATGAMQTGSRRCEMEMTLLKLCDPSLCSDIASLEKRVSALEAGGRSVNAFSLAEKPLNTQPSVTSAERHTTKVPEEPELEYAEDDVPPLPDDNDAASSGISEEKNGDNKKSDSPPEGVAPVEQWKEILHVLQSSCAIIAGVLQDSRAYIKGDYLLIDASNSQFRSMIKSDNALYRDSIRRAAAQVLGKSYKLGPYSSADKVVTDPLTDFSARVNKLKL